MKISKLLLLIALPCAMVTGQNNPLAGRDTLVLVGERIESLPPISKPSFTFPKPDYTFSAQGLNYKPDSIKYQPKPSPFEINRAPVPKPLWQRLYNHHIMGGIGAFITPVVRAYFTNGRSTNKHLVVQAEHFSTPNGHTDFATFSRNRIQISGSLIQKKYKLYTRARFHHFQFNRFADTLVDRWQENSNFIDQLELERSIRGRFIQLALTAGISSNDTSRLSFDLPVSAEHYNDRQDVREWHISLEPDLAFRINDKFLLQGGIHYTYSGMHFVVPDTNLSFQRAQFFGSIVYLNGPIRLEGGIRTAYAGLADSSSFQVYPILKAQYKVFQQLQPYVSITGSMHYLNRNTIAPNMPYLRKDQIVLPYSEQVNARAGIQGSVKKLNYDVAMVMRNGQNLPVYFSTDVAGTYYGTELAPGEFLALREKSFGSVGTDVNVGYDWTGKLRSAIRFQYNSYTLQNLEHYFQMPEMQGSLSTSYNFKSKLLTEVVLNYFGSRTMSVDSLGATTSADAYPDLNLHIEYILSRRFSLFCEFNNLLNAKYYRWNGYLERPLDFRLGGTVSF